MNKRGTARTLFVMRAPYPKFYEDAEAHGQEQNTSAERSHAHEGSAPDGATRPAPSAERSHTPNKPAKLVFGEFGNVMLTVDERRLLDEKLGVSASAALIEQLSGYIASKGAKYKSHYATLIQWHAREAHAQQSPPQSTRGAVTPNHASVTTNPFLKILEELGDE
ncbi:MAG: hypothetical protein LBS72_05240 [Oscillospiraceae bacterium]|jgi:hypothetical protein|nr:hypothetical protein [Oscillospiraceae bacterium]